MGTVANLVVPDNRRRRLVEAALTPDVLLGMPHLTPFGLSETWLMKEVAHRHWLMLGQTLGLDDADFRTPDGGEVYAAICASALHNAGLASVAANDILTIRSMLRPVGRMRTASTHVLSIDDRSVGEVEMISTFVHREERGRNGSIARVRSQSFDVQGPDMASALAIRAAFVRRGELCEAGLAADAEVIRSHAFTPSQMQDFNGAGLFYFASFQAVIDRAIEVWFGAGQAFANRETFFIGNIEPGDHVVVKLLAAPEMQLLLERGDGGIIARQVGTLRS